jgi:hypothetical protein
MLILRLIVKHSTFVQLMDKEDYPSTHSFALMELSSTKIISFATGGSISIVLKLKNFGLSMMTLLQKEKPIAQMVVKHPHHKLLMHLPMTVLLIRMLGQRVKQTMMGKLELDGLVVGKADGFVAKPRGFHRRVNIQ